MRFQQYGFFCHVHGIEFHFFMTTLKFLKINMGKLFPVPFKNASRRLHSHIVLCCSMSICFKMVLYTESTNVRGTASYPDLKFLCAGGLGAPSGRILIDSRNLTST